MNCQHEPPYPGETTVVFSIRYPDLTAHAITDRCQIEEPHLIADCPEWQD